MLRRRRGPPSFAVVIVVAVIAATAIVTIFIIVVFVAAVVGDLDNAYSKTLVGPMGFHTIVVLQTISFSFFICETLWRNRCNSFFHHKHVDGGPPAKKVIIFLVQIFLIVWATSRSIGVKLHMNTLGCT